MKKKYEKPILYIEDFGISQYIAGGCTTTNGATHYKDSCSINYPGTTMTIFTDAITTCTLKPDLEECHDTAIESMGLFYS